MYCPIFDSRITFDSIQKRNFQKPVGFMWSQHVSFIFGLVFFLLMIRNIKEFVLRMKSKSDNSIVYSFGRWCL